MQYRLLLLVGTLGIVLLVMDRARDPKIFEAFFSALDARSKPPPVNEQVDTRPPPSDGSVIITGPVQATPAFQQLTKHSGSDEDEVFQKTQLDQWTKLLAIANLDQRLLLQKMLKNVRDDRRIAPTDVAPWLDLVSRLDGEWTAFFEEAQQALLKSDQEVSDRQKEIWFAVLRRLQEDWERRLKPVLEGLAEDRGASLAERDVLNDLQSVLDRRAIDQIKDNTVFRGAESEAWFRFLDRLKSMPLDDIEEQSLGDVSFVQLYKQTDEYRGKLVTVRGSARLAYRTKAPKNVYGIEYHYVFWLKPQGPVNSPIVVFAIELPPGFPEVKDRDVDRDSTEMAIDVVFTGFFFKRWVYPSKGGTDTAPLILARTCRWTPPTAAAAPERPSYLKLGMLVAGALVIALLVAAFAHYQSRAVGSGPEAYAASARELAYLEQLAEPPAAHNPKDEPKS